MRLKKDCAARVVAAVLTVRLAGGGTRMDVSGVTLAGCAAAMGCAVAAAMYCCNGCCIACCIGCIGGCDCDCMADSDVAVVSIVSARDALSVFGCATDVAAPLTGSTVVVHVMVGCATPLVAACDAIDVYVVVVVVDGGICADEYVAGRCVCEYASPGCCVCAYASPRDDGDAMDDDDDNGCIVALSDAGGGAGKPAAAARDSIQRS